MEELRKAARRGPGGPRLAWLAGTVVALALAGCGSGGSSSGTEATTPAGPTAAAASPSQAPGHRGADRSQPGGEPNPAEAGTKAKAGAHANHRRRTHSGGVAAGGHADRAAPASSGSPGRVSVPRVPPKGPSNSKIENKPSGSPTEPSAAAAHGALGGSTDVERKLRRACPDGIDRASCGNLVKGYLKSRGSKSHVYSDPKQCEAALSREECETVLSQEAEAAENEGAVNVQACLANMTPHCEEVLRPIFEQQAAAAAE